MTLPPQMNDRIKDSFVSTDARNSVQQVLTVSESGKALNIDEDGSIVTKESGTVKDLIIQSVEALNLVIYELRKVNVHLSLITDTEKMDIKNEN